MIFKVRPNIKYPVLWPHSMVPLTALGVPHFDLETQ